MSLFSIKKLFSSQVLCLCLMLIQPELQADEQGHYYDRIKLHNSASAEVKNDVLIAILYAQKEGNDPAALTNSVNRLITQALKEAKGIAGVKVQTLGYQTSPIYQQQRLSGWRVRQSIRLQSMHSDRLSELLHKLQSTLALDSISYAISPAQRQKVEERLTLEVIDAFRKRADLVAKQFGRDTYRLVELSIQASDHTRQPNRLRANMMSMERASTTTAPALAAGSQTLRIEASGTIELQLDQ
jgi:predicted secreted protein